MEAYVHNQVESSFLLDIYHGGKDGKVIIDKETLNECGSINETKEVHDFQHEFFYVLIFSL